jgi:hypothetical protein
MPRFKEMRRIREAIQHGNEAELHWALSYCQMRSKLARSVHTMRKQEKNWNQMEREIRAALEGTG